MLLNESKMHRAKLLIQTLKSAKVRMPETKAKWLAQNFTLIQSKGGLKEI